MHPLIMPIWEALPKPIQDAVASTVDRVQGIPIPTPPDPPTAREMRVFIGPTNYAGQAWRWGRALEANPLVGSRNMISAEINGFGYPVDYSVRWRTMTHSRAWQRNMLQHLIAGYTHVIFEAEMPILGGMFDGDIRRQVKALRDGGIHVGMICHGTDARLPSRNRELEPWSPFINDEWVPVDRAEKVVQDNLDLLEDVAAPTFVSTPGLLLDVPYAHLLPVVIDPEPWVAAAVDAPLGRERLKVVHIPSNPVAKGTMLIEPALQRLHDEGTIEYIRVIEKTQEEMPKLFGTADVVIDQFRVGDYGVGACEAMAAGRLVVSHVSEQVRREVNNLSGLELPIVEATVESLESVLRDIAVRRNHYRAIAGRGPSFVESVHSGPLSRTVLERHFLFEQAAA